MRSVLLSIQPMGPVLEAYRRQDLAAIVAERAKREERRRIGLLGTGWTMEGPAYPAASWRGGPIG